MTGFIARAAIDVRAPRERVWAALTDPDLIARYMDGSRVETDWQVGSPIVWRGEIDGKLFEDKGEVLVVDEPHRLSVTHYSPLMGEADVPESYHTLVWTLTGTEGASRLELTQDGCADAAQAERFSAHWQRYLDGLQAVITA